MERKMNKRIIALLLSLLMVITLIPFSVFASTEAYPLMEAYNASSSADYHRYYNKVVSVTFLDSIDYNDITSSDTLYSWDVSANDDASVMAWMKKNAVESAAAGADRYDVYIAGEGGVGANPDSAYIFYCFSELKYVNNTENFKTDNATTFYNMFAKCVSLEYIDLSTWNTSKVTNLANMFNMEMYGRVSVLTGVDFYGWDTSNVTTMENMFKNCEVLEVLDLSSFNTAKVTTMRFMFYRCKKLDVVYIGHGWTTDAIANLNDGVFNCCYAMLDVTEDYYNNTIGYQPQESVEKAKYKEDGGYMEHGHSVTYKIIGDVVPEGVEKFSSETYAKGSVITVKEPYGKIGDYTFSGWTQETENAQITDGKFELPCGDVVFYGYFKIPVEEIIIDTENIENIEDGVLTLEPGEETKIEIKVTPDNATDKGVTFESSDESVVIIDKNGNIEAVGEGEAIITVTSKDDPTKTDSVVVQVKNPVVPVEKVVVEKDEFVLDITEKDKIEASVIPDDATNKELTYTSDDESIVKVDKYGNIEAVGKGTATITVASKDDPTKTAEVKVTVEVPVDKVIVEKEEITLDVGEKDEITVIVTPDDATDKSVIYESSDESVVKVDENGNIEAVGKGEATITVTSKDDPTKKTEIKVTVEVPVEKVVVDKEEITLDIGNNDKINASVVPTDATDKGIIFESDNEKVVRVDENGNIEAVGKGEATITVTSKDDPTKKTEIKVTVEVPVEDVEADKDEITLDLGSKDKINVTVTPDDASDKSVTYESSDETVVKVDENGNIEAVGEGTAIITVVSKENPEKYDTVKVTVEKPFIPVEEIEVTAQKNELEIGEETQLEVTVDPDDATDKSVAYESDDETVVKVDENGKVTAVGDGSATITVTANDGSGKKGTIVITVKKPVITYKVEHYKMDSSWSPYSKPDKTESFTGEAGETVNGQPVKFDGFAYNFFISDTVATLENGKETVLKLYYEPDTIGGKDGKADGIPDKYQKLITFEVRNGKWNDGTEAKKYSYVTLLKDGRWDESGEAAVVPPAVGSNPNEGYKTGSWNKDFVVGSNDIEVYIYSYVPIETEPETPTPDTPDTPDNPDAPVDPDEPDVPGGSGSVTIPVKHHICFGKTDGIGWYEVSVNGGDFFPQGPNSTLEVEEGSVVVVRTQDMWIDDDFTFYVNGSKVEEIAPNTITFTVNGYMLVGALSMDVEVPDAEESLNLFEKIIKGIKDFFEKIFSIFKKK